MHSLSGANSDGASAVAKRAALIAGLCLGVAMPALADVYNIPNGDVAALAAAIDDANMSAGPHTINLAAGGSYTLVASLPDITVNGLVINGNGATINGDDSFRVFFIDLGADVGLNNVNMTNGFGGVAGGAIFNSGTLSMLDCVITSSAAGANGGGIFNDGTLLVTDCAINGNASDDGAGIFTSGGIVIISGGEISGNTAFGNGGGAIYNNLGDVTVSGGAVLDDNEATQGGAIVNDGTLTITDSTIHANASEGLGGGILSFSGTILIEASTLSHNTADSAGGGVTVLDGTVYLINSTVSGNASALFGGGVLSVATVNVLNSTIVLNSAGASGGGIAILGGDTTTHNTIIGGNDVLGTPDEVSGSLDASSSFNILADASTSGGTTDSVNGNQVGVNLALTIDLTLGNNGGPTMTHALFPCGPAMDMGDPLLAASLTFDQRGSGFTRISGVSVDIGAVEFQQNAEFQGLVPLFWGSGVGKFFWPATGYTTTQLVSDVFGPAYPGSHGGLTLHQAVKFTGPPTAPYAEKSLLRQGVAALLNAGHPDINYALTESQVIQLVRTALDSGDSQIMLDAWALLLYYNAQGL